MNQVLFNTLKDTQTENMSSSASSAAIQPSSSASSSPHHQCVLPLLPRRFEPILSRRGNRDLEASSSFRLLQWNIMADTFSSEENYTRVPPGATAWAARRERILEEILRWHPDIVTLQEVDHYFDWMEPQMSSLGYTGFFMKKPLNQDGAATFVKRCKFTVLSSNSFNYLKATDDGGEKAVENQVALSVLLRLSDGKEGSRGAARRKAEGKEVHDDDDDPPPRPPRRLAAAREFLVVNTHLKAAKNVEGEKVRASQVKQLITQIQAQRKAYSETRIRRPCSHTLSKEHTQEQQQEKEELSTSPSSSLSVIVCGDFNATPQNKEEYQAEAVPLMLQADYQSAYSLTEKIGEPSRSVYTTWKYRPCRKSEGGETEIKHCIDYVFTLQEDQEEEEEKRTLSSTKEITDYLQSASFSSMMKREGEVDRPCPSSRPTARLIPRELLSLPTKEEVGPEALPSYRYPSDHLALGVIFQIE